MNEAEFSWVIEDLVAKNVSVEVSETLKLASGLERERAVVVALVCLCEHRNFDLTWLAKQLLRTDLPITREVVTEVLRDLYLDACELGLPFSWDHPYDQRLWANTRLVYRTNLSDLAMSLMTLYCLSEQAPESFRQSSWQGRSQT